ncbi:MAG: hypothetical protein ABFD60_07920 [Bryobacteraceae bacterium]
MGDNGRWFKLWCSCVGDPGLDTLSIADFGRWAKLGAIIKEHGTDGKLVVYSPARSVCAALQLDSFDALVTCVSMFPNVQMRRENSTVSPETFPTVSFTIEYCNWSKYQGDFSTPRVRRFREKTMEMKRSKRRREEKRIRGEKEVLPVPPPAPPPAPQNGFASWPEEWKPILDKIHSLPFLVQYQHWLTDLDWWKSMDELFSSCPKRLDALLLDAAAYVKTEGYRPRSSKALRMKLRNCMEFSARRAERESQGQQRAH